MKKHEQLSKEVNNLKEVNAYMLVTVDKSGLAKMAMSCNMFEGAYMVATMDLWLKNTLNGQFVGNVPNARSKDMVAN